MLTVAHHIPDGLLTTPATQLHQVLPGPTLCHLTGTNPRPLFVSVLLHGNETTGLIAVQKLLTQYAGRTLPRSLSIFIGNVEAARWQRRHLDDQPDFNRIWCGDGGEAFSMAECVLRDMARRDVFAAIDIHNNSAANPDYAMITRLDAPSIALARMFSDKLVFFLQPHSAQSSAFGEICPAVTIECGVPGNLGGVANSVSFLDRILNLNTLPTDPGSMDTLNLYRIAAIIKVSPSRTFGFDPDKAQTLCFMVDPGENNFKIMPKETLFAIGCDSAYPCLEVIDLEGKDVFDQFFSLEGSKLVTASAFVPAMLTMNLEIIRQDCLGYILDQVRHLPLPGAEIIDQRLKRGYPNT